MWIGRADARMPVIGQNLPAVAVMDAVVVSYRGNLPWSPLPFCAPDVKPDQHGQKKRGVGLQFCKSSALKRKRLDFARVIAAGDGPLGSYTGERLVDWADKVLDGLAGVFTGQRG